MIKDTRLSPCIDLPIPEWGSLEVRLHTDLLPHCAGRFTVPHMHILESYCERVRQEEVGGFISN